MMGFVVGKPRQIYVMIRKYEYDLARTAYLERLPVVCSGDLVKENGRFVLRNPSSFALSNTLTEKTAV
jgi:NMD protein affecting ribosome stability and mRNA decay